MKILIVDDEPFYIEQFKKKLAIAGSESGVEIAIAGECYDGREALDFIAKDKPDAVFTDIRMSALDGIELAKAIRQRYPELPVVIVSAYPSFDYLREAMRVNVSEYLLKPIEMQALKAILDKLSLQCRSRSNKMARDCLQAVLASPQLEETTVQAALRALVHPYYRALFIRNRESVYEYPVLAPNIEEDNEVLQEALRPLLTGQPSWIIPLDDGRSRLIVLALTDANGHDLSAILATVSAHYASDGIRPSIIYSDAFADILTLNRLVPTLRTALADRIVIGKPSYFELSGLSVPLTAPYSDIERAKLDKLMVSRDTSGASAFIRGLFRSWENGSYPMKTIGKRMKEIVSGIERNSGDSSRLEPGDGDARIDELLQTARTLPELAEGFLSMLALVFEWDEAEQENGDFSRLFARIETYIASHIGQPLSLPLLTEQFHVSKTLLCNLFRDYTGKSFVEYVTSYRMRKAQDLMRYYPRMRNKEIAEMVGYPDQNYFSRVFTTAIGMSPSDFRSRSAASGD
ncbi:response regulator [Cohnella endophytica]|uniref:Response regulator n=1 Tax=Cohnella endophytica TaxID=2419778 RepID=A0A494XCX4_9BACL|nr:response regulator [Cohnella endophytica]RKP45433.1 response regulator [Cohnella endophytica]